MTTHRMAVGSALGVAIVAGILALVAAASTADRCQTVSEVQGRTAHAVCGPILAAYLEEHGPDGGLGPSTSEEHEPEPVEGQSPGHRQQYFDDGVIDLDVATGEVQVARGNGFVPIT